MIPGYPLTSVVIGSYVLLNGFALLVAKWPF